MAADDRTALYCCYCRVMGSPVHGALKGAFDPETFAGWLVYGKDEWLEYDDHLREGMFFYFRHQDFTGDDYLKAIAVTSDYSETIADRAQIVVRVSGENGVEWKKGEAEYASKISSLVLVSAAGIFMRCAAQCLARGLVFSSVQKQTDAAT